MKTTEWNKINEIRKFNKIIQMLQCALTRVWKHWNTQFVTNEEMNLTKWNNKKQNKRKNQIKCNKQNEINST